MAVLLAAGRAPLAWRAGNLKDIRAVDPYTVEYELNEPFSDLLLNLTMFTTAIHNKESVEALGKDLARLEKAICEQPTDAEKAEVKEIEGPPADVAGAFE